MVLVHEEQGQKVSRSPRPGGQGRPGQPGVQGYSWQLAVHYLMAATERPPPTSCRPRRGHPRPPGREPLAAQGSCMKMRCSAGKMNRFAEAGHLFEECLCLHEQVLARSTWNCVPILAPWPWFNDRPDGRGRPRRYIRGPWPFAQPFWAPSTRRLPKACCCWLSITRIAAQRGDAERCYLQAATISEAARGANCSTTGPRQALLPRTAELRAGGRLWQAAVAFSNPCRTCPRPRRRHPQRPGFRLSQRWKVYGSETDSGTGLGFYAECDAGNSARRAQHSTTLLKCVWA